MKTLYAILIVGLTLGGFSVSATAQDEMGSLTINVTNITDGEGNIHISIYRPTDKWLSRKSKNIFKELEIARSTFTAEGTASAEIELPQGNYAISLYYDENGNGKLNTGFLIPIPKEPTGFSNGYKPGGIPKYDRAAFTLGSGSNIQNIELTE